MQVSHQVSKNFWQHVNKDKDVTLDKDRAVEYVRRYCQDAKTFKLFLMAAGIAFGQVRNSAKEIISILADFHYETTCYSDVNLSRIRMDIELAVELPNGRRAPKSHHYHMTLLVNQDGFIVDVDLNSLAHQVGKSLERFH